jgi:hypothetical protein
MQTLCCPRAGAPTSSVSVATSEQEPKCFHGSPRTSEASSPSWAATRCRREIPPMMMTRTKKTKRTRTGTKNRRSSENPTDSAAHRPVATRERVPLQEDCSGSGALKDGHTWEPKPSALRLPAGHTIPRCYWLPPLQTAAKPAGAEGGPGPVTPVGRQLVINLQTAKMLGLLRNDLKTRKHRGVLSPGSAIRSRRPGAHLQLNVHTPMGMGNKFLNTARSRERGP